MICNRKFSLLAPMHAHMQADVDGATHAAGQRHAAGMLPALFALCGILGGGQLQAAACMRFAGLDTCI